MIAPARIAEIAKASNGYSEAVVVPGVFGADFISQADVAGILRQVSSDVGNLGKVRAYEEHAVRPDLQSAVFQNPPSETDLESWGKSLFDGRRFGIVVDRPAIDDDRLAERLSLMLADIRDTSPVEFGSVEPHIFVGDYGYSPFGAHHDEETGRILHFHLGPGTKRMYIWDDETYVAATGSRASCFDPRSILELARCYELHAGDVMVLPTEGFHVGHTPEFSIGFAICLEDHDPAEMLRQAAAEALDQEISERLDADPGADRSQRLGEVIEDGLHIDLARAVWQASVRTRSNLGLEPASPLRADAMPSGAVRRLGAFPVIYEERGDDALLAARGHLVELPASAALRDTVDLINRGEPVSPSRLVAGLAGGFDDDAASYLIGLLWSWRALTAADAVAGTTCSRLT